MRLLRRSVLLLSSLGLVLAISSHALAQTRTFVSSAGNDANVGCPRATPCRNLQAGVNAVASGGEVIVMDSAGYGSVSINKGLTITAGLGIYAGVSVSSGTGITVAAGAGDVVTLINLQVNGTAGGTTGLHFTGGQALYIKDCLFAEFGGAGVLVANATGRVSIEHSVFNGNNTGLRVTSGRVTVSNSAISNNTEGITAEGDGGASLNPPSGTTMVRVAGGTMTDNSTALIQTNAGTRASASCNGTNIYLHTTSSGIDVIAVGNTTFVTATGSSDLNSACAGPPTIFNVGTFSSPAS